MLEPGVDYRLSEDRGIDLGHYILPAESPIGASAQCTFNAQGVIEWTMNEHHCRESQGLEVKENTHSPPT